MAAEVYQMYVTPSGSKVRGHLDRLTIRNMEAFMIGDMVILIICKILHGDSSCSFSRVINQNLCLSFFNATCKYFVVKQNILKVTDATSWKWKRDVVKACFYTSDCLPCMVVFRVQMPSGRPRARCPMCWRRSTMPPLFWVMSITITSSA